MTEEEIQEEAKHIFETRMAILNADDPTKRGSLSQMFIAQREADEHAHELRVRNGLIKPKMPHD